MYGSGRDGVQRLKASTSRIFNPVKLKANLESATGVGLALLSGISYAFAGFFMTLADLCGVGIFQVLFSSQFLFAFLLIFPASYYQVKITGDNHTDRILLLASGLSYTINEICSLLAYQYIPIGNFTAVINGSIPIFVAILGYIFLKEKWKKVDMLVTLVNIIGIILVTQPSFIFDETESLEDVWNATMFTPVTINISSTTTPVTVTSGRWQAALGYSMTIAASIGISVSYIICRGLEKRQISLLTILLYDAITATCSACVLLVIFQSTIMPENIQIAGIYVGITAFEALAHWSSFQSVRLENAATVAILFNFEVFVSYLIQNFQFHIRPTWMDMTGAVIIVCSSAAVSIYTWRQHYKTLQQQDEEYDTLIEFSELE